VDKPPSATATSAPPRTRGLERPLVPYLFVLPTWLVLGLFFLVPLLLLFAQSFGQRGVYGGLAAIDDLRAYVLSFDFLDNYVKSWRPVYLSIYWRSLWMALLTTLLCVLVGYPVAYYIARLAPRRFRPLLLALIVIPFWTSFLIRTYAWMFLLRSQGLFNTMLLAAGVIDAPLDLLYRDLAVMIGLVYGELPFLILPLFGSLERLDASLLEAATDLGAGRLASFRRVTFPLALPGLVAGVVLVFVPSLGQFIVPDLLGGAKSILIGNLVQNQFAVARNRPFGSAIAFELTSVVLLLLLAYTLWERRRSRGPAA
jgi:spermidine/putrescine transport system permease protein